MGELLHFPDELESQPDGVGKGGLLRPTPSIASSGLTNALGACLEGLLSSLARLEGTHPSSARQQIRTLESAARNLVNPKNPCRQKQAPEHDEYQTKTGGGPAS
jgi:hypothetical protein